MKYTLCVTLAILSMSVLACQAADDDEELSEGNKEGDVVCNIIEAGSTIMCKRLGKAKCNKNNSTAGNETDDDCKCSNAPIAIRLVKVEEVDEDDKAVGGASHSFTLQKKDFKLPKGGHKSGAKLPNGKGGKSPKGKQRDIMLKLQGDKATLTMSLFLLNEDGELDQGGEATTLKKGQLKINTRLEDWEWCGNNATYQDDKCGGKPGDGVMVYFAVENKKANGKKPKAGKHEKNTPKKYTMDCGGFVEFSTKVFLDNETWVNMGENYPKLVENAEDKVRGQMFGVRLPKFENMADYDPTMNTASEDGGTDDGNGAGALYPVLLWLMAGLVALILV